MYMIELLDNMLPTTLVKIRYDCCDKEHKLKWKDANKNFTKNNGKHICRSCWLKSDANPAKKKENIEKAKKTNLKRYGTSIPMNKEEQIEKRRQNFNNEEWLLQWNEKRKKTCIERYGVEHQTQTEDFKAKQKQTMIENWGVDNPMKSEEIKAKAKQTNLERYRVEYTSQLPENREKAQKTMEERYGVKNYNELPEMREYMKKHCKEWLQESWESGWQKDIPKSEEQKQKQSETMARLLVEGKLTPEDNRFYVTGYFSSNKCKKPKAFFRSSLELKMHYLLHTNSDVEWYENEPFAIPYKIEGKGIRNYVPDFFVKYTNSKPSLLEIKPGFRMRELEVQYKVKVAKKYANDNNCEFEYVDEKFLKDNILLTLEQLGALSFVEIIKKPE